MGSEMCIRDSRHPSRVAVARRARRRRVRRPIAPLARAHPVAVPDPRAAFPRPISRRFRPLRDDRRRARVRRRRRPAQRAAAVASPRRDRAVPPRRDRAVARARQARARRRTEKRDVSRRPPVVVVVVVERRASRRFDAPFERRDDASAVAGADERAGVGEGDEGVAAVRRRATARRDGVDDERHRVALWRRGEISFVTLFAHTRWFGTCRHTVCAYEVV